MGVIALEEDLRDKGEVDLKDKGISNALDGFEDETVRTNFK